MLDSTTDSLPSDSPLADLGPLAWVFDEVRKSLEGANKATKRFVREATHKTADDLDAPDPTPLRSARQQLHQAVGALEMVGLEQPAQLLRGMEAAVQRFVQRPQACDEAAVQQVEQAGFALLEYLQALLNNKPLQPLVLFPQYRAVQKLAGVERIHPADLWSFDRQSLNLNAPLGVKALSPNETLRSMFERSVLLVVKTQSAAAAKSLTRLCAGLSAGADAPRVRTFWYVAAAYFEGTGALSMPVDVYAKRSASRILLQFNALTPSGGQGVLPTQISETLLRDLLFFCAYAQNADDETATPYMAEVRQVFGLKETKWVDYSLAALGRFDPALLAQARKRVHSAKDAWGLFTGGDVNRGRQVVDQYGLVGDSLILLHPASAGLADTLNRAVEQALKEAKHSVRPELSMEVATTTLYLEAAFDDFDPADVTFGQRCDQLAERLQRVLAGEPGSPLDAWMEQLYRRVSDRQTMGSVVGELKVSLAETEKTLDQFFRLPHEKAGLVLATSQLSQMRGVLSVLGLEQGVQTVNRMRATVDQLLDADREADPASDVPRFQQLGNNLSALSFLVDMLNYQPMLAKKLFVFDEDAGELRPLMGRVAAALPEAGSVGQMVDQPQTAAEVPDEPPTLTSVPAPSVVEPADAGVSSVSASAATSGEDDDDQDLLEIFLEEAREVVTNGLDAIRTLQGEPDELEPLTTLRRAFHTLKGSSRMVGLTAFGEAAWAMEQLFNAVLAEQRPATPDLLALANQSLGAFGRWADSIESQSDLLWQAQPFIDSALALRERSAFVSLDVPGAEAFLAMPAWEPDAGPVEELVESPLARPIEEPQAIDEAPEDGWLPGEFAETSSAALEVSEPEPAEGTELSESESLMGHFDLDSLSLPKVGTEAPPPSDNVGAGALPSMFGDLSLDLDDFPALLPQEPPAEEAAREAAATPADEPLPELAEEGVADPVLDEETVTLDAPAPDAVSEAVESADAEPGKGGAEVDAEAVSEPVVEPATFEAQAVEPDTTLPDEQTRLIGPLRIDLKLYNVYLNEADEWSRRLGTVLSEWLLEFHEPLPNQAESLAHSLAGSSATVGFQPLSDIARALENALGAVASHQREGRSAQQAQAQLFSDAAEDIRRLLHQFAAGFYKEPSADTLSALQQLLLELPPPTDSADLDLDLELHSHWHEDPQGQPSEVADAGAELPLAVEAPDEEVPSAFAPPDFEPSAFAEEPTLMAPLSAVGKEAQPAQDIDDDIDVMDTIDVDLFPIFAEESLELLPRLGSALRQWVARPENGSARAEVLRNLHTIKGSARLAGALRLGEMAHRMETEAERIDMDRLGDYTVTPLLGAYDAIVARFDMLRAMDPEVHGVLQSAPEQLPPAVEALVQPEPEWQASVSVSVETQEAAAESSEVASAPKGLVGLSLPSVPRPPPTRAGAAVRVRPELLDRLVNQTGEVITSRTRMDSDVVTLRTSLKELTVNLERLRLQLHDMELQAETQMQARLAQARDADQTFDPLELDRFTRVQEITRMMAESVNDVATVQRSLQRAVESTEDGLAAMGRQTRELQRDLLRTRMVEFEGISERLYRVVRQATKETGKQVRLDISGGHIEMDRGVLDRMTAAFEHLLRNAVVHGVEKPEERLAAGKSADGHINIHLAQELNDVSVVFQDDGAGLNLPRLREKAMAMGLVMDGAELSDAQAADLVFTPGLSTATEVSSLAGRGVGMDVVRNDVVALGGRVETSTRPGQGTAFKMVLPLTTAVTQVVMVRAGNFTVGVPSSVVERVRRVSPAELAQAYAKGTLTVGDEQVPFYWAGALLQTSAESTQVPERTLPVVIFRSAAQRVAMHVDEVLGNQEVVVKNLGSQLSRLPGLAGMSVLASGAVALIYNPVALASVYGAQVREWLARQSVQPGKVVDSGLGELRTSAANAVPMVLVVDDSITVRRVTQRLLQREGYRVTLAADGLQALERLQQERPSVVLSDIEMPRMDGFDLVRNLRNDPRLADLPVIMITSRIAEKHREHARELGVDHYLGKPYPEDELLGLIARYARVSAEA